MVGTCAPAGNPALAFGTIDIRFGLTLSRTNDWLTPVGAVDERVAPTVSVRVEAGETPIPIVDPAPPSPVTDAVERTTLNVVVATDPPGDTDVTVGVPTIPGPRAT